MPANKLLRNAGKLNENFFHNPTAENVLAFKQLKAKTRYIIKKQKKISWQNFCTSLNSKTKAKTVWKAIRKTKGEKSNSCLIHLKVDRKLVTNKKQIADLIAATVSNKSSSEHYSPNFRQLKRKKRENLLISH